MDEDLEFEYLSCRYDRWLINRAIKTQQQLAAHTYVVEAFVVYKVRREATLSSEAIIGTHRNCVVPPYTLRWSRQQRLTFLSSDLYKCSIPPV